MQPNENLLLKSNLLQSFGLKQLKLCIRKSRIIIRKIHRINKEAERANDALLQIIWRVDGYKIVFFFQGYAVTNDSMELGTLLCLQCSVAFVALFLL
jgi:hypothetical protein